MLIWLAIGQRSLEKAAENIAKPLREGNTNEARRQTAMIVSRDTETMQEKDMVRSAVESVGENTSDGVTAPLFYALLEELLLLTFIVPLIRVMQWSVTKQANTFILAGQLQGR